VAFNFSTKYRNRTDVAGALPRLLIRDGDAAVVRRIAVEDTALLGLLTELGIGLDAEVRVDRVDPYDGPLHIAVDGHDAVIGTAAAREVLVETR